MSLVTTGYANSVDHRVHESTIAGPTPVCGLRTGMPICQSREAAAEYSPWRKPWVNGVEKMKAPEGATETSMDGLPPPLPGLMGSFRQFTHGLRHGLYSFAPPGLSTLETHSEKRH